MEFYESIVDYYNHIFPFNVKQVEFVTDCDDEVKRKNIIEIGCGTGQLTNGLAEIYKSATGIDLDGEMIGYAKSKYSNKENINFVEMNMLNIDSIEDVFDIAVCFGNTLVHLSDEFEIREFIKKVYERIEEGGKFMVQIINYDRILDQKIDSLPTIENEHIRFIRKYNISGDGHIEFNTVLNIKENGSCIENEILLYPLRTEELIGILTSEGFINIKSFGSWTREEFDKKGSIPLIVESQKPRIGI